MDQTVLAKAALAFLARDAKANGFEEARALIKVSEWISEMAEGKQHSAPEPPPANGQEPKLTFVPD